MKKPVNPKRSVTFIRAHTVVHPATVLEINGEVVPHTERPEKTDVYVQGQVLEFGSVASARSFARAMNGAAVVGLVEV